MYTSLHSLTHTHMHARRHTHTHTHTYACTCMHTHHHMHAWTHPHPWYIYIYVLHAHVHTHAHAHMHAHMQHTHTCTRPVYPSFHLSVLCTEVVSNPKCLSVIHTLHFSLLYSYLTQCFKQLYSQLIFTQTKIVTNEGTIASSSSAIAFCLNYY